jgi:hypothetical protein
MNWNGSKKQNLCFIERMIIILKCVTCKKTDHDLNAIYCADCGTNLLNPIICECGKSNHTKYANYCTNCGKKVVKVI